MANGDALRTRRESLSLSQADLAGRLGVHVMTVSKWERNVNDVPPWVWLALTGLEAERKPKRRTRAAQGGTP